MTRSRRLLLPVTLFASLTLNVAIAADAARSDPHPAGPTQGASPPSTQGPAQASRNADETMSEKAPRPIPGKDPAPGPSTDSPKAKSQKADETMSNDAPRAPATP
ncbi:MAG: hypothetical protein K0Q76_3851 [Panacagrimonas sp.]|nr:hypothetical protein [Panacagrimonas sp.]MCC2658743.1 hypothetical protein [Panacagrimonas sp.]